ncbi:hypothetical protein BH09BAC2_BH09BAC2_03900 [soil metagenome]
MKTIYLIISLAFCLGTYSCNSSKTAVITNEDKTLLKAIKKLDKHPEDGNLQTNVALLYKDAAQSHLDKIDLYKSEDGIEKWDKLVKEYEALNGLYNKLSGSAVAVKALKLSPYTRELNEARQTGAEAYYTYGKLQLAGNTRETGKEAYYAFKKAVDLIPGYKDSKQLMNTAFEKSTIKVVINPVRDNSFYYGSLGRNNYGNSFNNDNFQRNLVADLGGSNNRSTPAKFYTDWDAKRARINADWVVDLTWLDLDIPQPYTNQYSRAAQKQIEAGRDTAGRPYYQTVSATIYVTRQYFSARGNIEVRITDANDGNMVLNNTYSDTYDWQQETGSYSGDSRALSSSDWSMINNRSYVRMPRKDDILNELYRRIYPQVRNQIYNAVSW